MIAIMLLTAGNNAIAQKMREMPWGWGNFDESMWLEHCEELVAELNISSEAMDRSGDAPSESTQRAFRYDLNEATACVKKLNELDSSKRHTTGDYGLSKDWFGSGYTLKEP